MEWNPVLEERLKKARSNAGWRWIGYIGVAFGLFALIGGWVALEQAKEACEKEAGAFETCKGNTAVFLAPGGVIAGLGFILAIPAEKSAKQAKELMAQKKAAEAATVPSSATGRACTGCNAPIGAARFCPECGMPQPSN